MANVKQVYIEGHMPFDICATSDKVCRFLGVLNEPLNGLRISYPKTAIPRLDKFKYYFIIEGEEAVSWKYLEARIEEMVEAGVLVSRASAKDIEEMSGVVHIKPELWYK